MLIRDRSKASYHVVADEQDLRAELDRVLAGQPTRGMARDVTIESWRRAAALGLRPDHRALPCCDDLAAESTLERLATPVLDDLAGDLAQTEISLVLADARGRILARRVPDRREAARLDHVNLIPQYDWAFEHAGTNGLSDALRRAAPSWASGREHFCEALADMMTVGVPIRDPRSAQMVGVLALVCSVAAANPLLLPIASRAARDIEQRLLRGRSALDRHLEERFLKACKRARSPLALVSPDRLLTNAAAARYFTAADQPRLWDIATMDMASAGESEFGFTPSFGSALTIRLEPVFDGSELAAVLVRVTRPDQTIASPSRTSTLRRPSFGWDSLTEAELSVTELVAEGLTNRQIATKLWRSPYTIDAHLRHIFHKLCINSRVELLRIATSRILAGPTLVDEAAVA
jgi:transcriptional regulator of acetoin/glycerol metabolism/DNA-binding CsgD family transcriptional regulator